MNKLFRIFLLCAFLIGICCFCGLASAESSLAIALSGPENEEISNEVTYTLTLSKISGNYVNYTASLNYNSNYLAYKDCTIISVPEGWKGFSGDNGRSVVFLISDESTINPSSEGFIVDVTFEVVLDSAFDIFLTLDATISGTAVEDGQYYNITGSSASLETAVYASRQPNVVVPKMLKTIDTEAFSGIGATAIEISENTIEIGAGAFAHNLQLKQIFIPTSVTKIGTNAFDGCDNVTIVCEPGSYAHAYAHASQIPYVFVQ